MTPEPSDLPPGWKRLPLENLLPRESVFADGDWVESKDQDPAGDVRLIQLADVGDGVYRNKSARFLTSQKARELRCTFLESGDVLVARMPDPLGRACIFPGDSRASVTVVDVCIIRPGRSGPEPRWLAWFLNCPQVRAQIAALQAGTTRKRISRSNLSTVELNVPPKPEQLRIVAEIEKQFTRLDAGVDALKRLQAHLKRYRATVLVAATEGRLVPSEASLARRAGRVYEPGSDYLRRLLRARRELPSRGKYTEPPQPDPESLPELPEGWTWTTVESVGDVLLGRQRAPQYLTGRCPKPYLRVANVGDDNIDLSDVNEMDFDAEHFTKYRLEPGDILVSEGQSPELLGQSAIYNGGIDGLCFQKTLHRFRPLPGGPSRFAQLVFRSHVKSGVFRRLGSITTNIGHLTLEKFKAAPFPLPPEAEEKRIVAEAERLLSSADATDALVTAQLRRAAALRRAILATAFEGRLVEQDPSERWRPCRPQCPNLRQPRARTDGRVSQLRNST